MNEKMKSFMEGMGALIEIWTITYDGFLARGFDELSALTHTKAFMEIMLKNFSSGDANDIEKGNENDQD